MAVITIAVCDEIRKDAQKLTDSFQRCFRMQRS